MIRKVKTENGWVRGIEAADPRITAFKGIPFAKPPVGENRWRAPQPCEDWEGVKDAFRFAPISVQDTPGLGSDIYCREWHVDPDIEMDEDCLYLNVWTSAKNPDEKQPVLVWFFGGALQWGYTAEMEFDGERLARRGIVVVTVNYRINSFGFLAHPDITREQPDAPANFGHLDQQAGVKWVKRNIAAFGGDPDNITIGGQSAGGGSVMSQMASPTNKGLFQKAVIMSAMILNPYERIQFIHSTPLEEAEKMGEKFFELLGVKTLAEARKLDAYYIRDKYAEFRASNGIFAFVTDNKFCVDDPMRMFIKGGMMNIPVMTGNTADEFHAFIRAFNEDELKEKSEKLFKDDADKFLSFEETHKCVKKGEYAEVNGVEIAAKSIMSNEARKDGRRECYYYCFDADIPGDDKPGAFHSVDLWFFFETLSKCSRPFVGRHYDLARNMCDYWANFIKTGNPNGKDADGTDLPEWKVYTKDEPNEMLFTPDGPKTRCVKESDFKLFLMDKLKDQLME